MGARDMAHRVHKPASQTAMQAGFAFLEAGSVRSKSTTTILLKNSLDTCVSRSTSLHHVRLLAR